MPPAIIIAEWQRVFSKYSEKQIVMEHPHLNKSFLLQNSSPWAPMSCLSRNTCSSNLFNDVSI